MNQMKKARMNNAIREKVFEFLSEEDKDIIAALKTSHYWGPLPREDRPVGWEGFHASGKKIVEKISDEFPSLWYEKWSECVLTQEPEPWEDEETGETFYPEGSDYFYFDRRAILETVLGSELASIFR